MAQTATPEERELICDLADGTINGKQYLNRLQKQITRDVVAGHFLEILRDDPLAKLTKQLKADVEKRFGVRSSLSGGDLGEGQKRIHVRLSYVDLSL